MMGCVVLAHDHDRAQLIYRGAAAICYLLDGVTSLSVRMGTLMYQPGDLR